MPRFYGDRDARRRIAGPPRSCSERTAIRWPHDRPHPVALPLRPRPRPTPRSSCSACYKTDDGPRLASDDPAFAVDAARRSGRSGCRAPSTSCVGCPAPGDGSPIALVGLGAAHRRMSTPCATPPGSAARQLTGIERLAVALPVADRPRRPRPCSRARASAPTPTRATGSGRSAPTKTPADEITVHVPAELAGDGRRRSSSGADDRSSTAVHTVRDLVSTPASDLYPETLAAAADRPRAAGCRSRWRCSTRRARRRRLRRHPRRRRGLGAPAASRHVCATRPRAPRATSSLVGKGITFDTGGLPLKPASGDDQHEVRHDRRRDRAGGARRRRATRTADPAVTARMCIAENMVSGIVDAAQRRAAHPRRRRPSRC